MKYAERNGYMLTGALAKKGYDWWWHSFVGTHKTTGEKKPFFIEYFIINPALGGDEPVFGQTPVNKAFRRPPSYGMVKAGSWGPDKAQIHNFYSISQVMADPKKLDVRIGPHRATETRLKGAVALSDEEVREHPEYMADAGWMQWDLSAKKVVSYSVGYGASRFFRKINAFRMFWHVQGMGTEYSGRVMFNGEEYLVSPESSAGYQDKNWGQDFTSPWIWLNCNNFVSRNDGPLKAYLDVGGGNPVVFGIPLGKKIITAFHYKGKLYEFNFSKGKGKQVWDCRVSDEAVFWDITCRYKDIMLKIAFSCPKELMLKVNYENPAGLKEHNELWNGGHASGTVEVHRKRKGAWVLEDTLDGSFGGCEYGVAQ